MGGPISGYARGGEVMEEKDRKRMERKRQRAAAKQRGEYEVADWFRDDFANEPQSPLGAGWTWKNKPNWDLQKHLLDETRKYGDGRTKEDRDWHGDRLYDVTPQATLLDNVNYLRASDHANQRPLTPREPFQEWAKAVSYTHLTLPTILLV